MHSQLFLLVPCHSDSGDQFPCETDPSAVNTVGWKLQHPDTTGYTSGKFNSEEFWDYMRQIGKDNQVFISELEAPGDFVCVWERPFTRTLDRNKNNQFKVVEKLFTYKG